MPAVPDTRRCRCRRRCRRVRRGLLIVLTAGGAYLLARWLQARSPRTGLVWESPDPDPIPGPRDRDDGPTPVAERSITEPAGAPTATPAAPDPDGNPASWVEPVDGGCPPSHPVKAKLSSGIYHVPGGLSYDRTRPDRCYRDAAAAEADGLRAARR